MSKIIWNKNASVEDNIKSKMQVPKIKEREKYKCREASTNGDEGGARGRALVGEGIVVEKGALEIGRSFVISPTRGETNSDKPTRGGHEYSKSGT